MNTYEDDFEIKGAQIHTRLDVYDPSEQPVDFVPDAPIGTAHALVFSDEGKILLGRVPGTESWSLPGGTIEDGEDPVQTLKRECIEEIDVELKDITLFGIQKVFCENNPDPRHGDEVYQYRYVAKIKELLPQTIDPCKQVQWERGLFPIEDLPKLIWWGDKVLIMAQHALKYLE